MRKLIEQILSNPITEAIKQDISDWKEELEKTHKSIIVMSVPYAAESISNFPEPLKYFIFKGRIITHEFSLCDDIIFVCENGKIWTSSSYKVDIFKKRYFFTGEKGTVDDVIKYLEVCKSCVKVGNTIYYTDKS